MVTAVVVTYNSAPCIGACLEAIATQLPDAELVVVDNASTDESVDVARGAGGRVVALPENEGFGRACNAGVEQASGDHVLFVNPDVTLTFVDRDALDALLGERRLGLLAGKLVDADGNARAERDLEERSLLADFLDHTLFTLRPRELPRPQLTQNAGGGWASAALLLARRAEFRELGGFDPRFFLYYEDRDLCSRYIAAGLPVRAVDALVGTHLGGHSSADQGMRVAPMGWALVSWLQYVHIHRGERAAERAAAAAWYTLRALRSSLAAAARIAPRGRIARKHAQLTSVIHFVRERARAEDGHSPDATRALAKAVS